MSLSIATTNGSDRSLTGTTACVHLELITEESANHISSSSPYLAFSNIVIAAKVIFYPPNLCKNSLLIKPN